MTQWSKLLDEDFESNWGTDLLRFNKQVRIRAKTRDSQSSSHFMEVGCVPLPKYLALGKLSWLERLWWVSWIKRIKEVQIAFLPSFWCSITVLQTTPKITALNGNNFIMFMDSVSQKFRYEAAQVTFFWCPIFGGNPGSLEWLLNNEIAEWLVSEGLLMNVSSTEAGMTRRLG